MVEAIFYVLRTAVAWRDLPSCYGSWNSAYSRWRRWCALGLWQEILRVLSRHAVGRIRFVDGSHIKLYQFGTNPAGGQNAQAIGRTKGGLNTKLCALVEGQGWWQRGCLPAKWMRPGLLLLYSKPLRMFCWWATRALMSMPCANSCRLRVVWPAFPRDRVDALPRGITEAFIASGTKSKTFSSGSRFISASRLVMKNSPSPFSTLSSSPPSSTGLNQFKPSPESTKSPMKTILVAAITLLIEGAAYSQVQPDTATPDGRISAIAAKFCDMYSQDPKLEA